MSTQLTLGKVVFYPDPNRVQAIRTTFQPTISSSKESPKKTPQLESTGQQMERQFRSFHAANPKVYDKLRQYVLIVKRNGRKIGIRLAWERMRWDMIVETNDKDFRLNNNYTAQYARLLMQQEPELVGYFETRRSSR